MNDRLKTYRWADRVTSTAAKLNTLLKEEPDSIPNPPEIATELIDRLVGLTGHTPTPIEPQVKIAAGNAFRNRLDFVVEWLNITQTRATYGSVANLLGVNTRVLLNYLGERCQRLAWIVNAKSGLPTGYTVDLYPEGLLSSDLVQSERTLSTLMGMELLSGYWNIPTDTAVGLNHIYLHRKQAEPSFFAGRITGAFAQPDGKWAGKSVFKFVPDINMVGTADNWFREKAIEGDSVHLIHRGNTGLLAMASVEKGA